LILHGDCLDLMAEMEPNSVDAIVTDPPYGLTEPRAYKSFRSATEDGRTEDEKAARRGGFMGKKWDGTGIEQNPATWEACLRVLKPGGTLLAFGGTRTFHRIAVAIEDAGFQLKDTLCWLHGQGFPKGKAQLKPAFEPIIMARKPGSAVLQIDACRIGTESTLVKCPPNSLGRMNDDGWKPKPGFNGSESGRWPANVILDETAAALLDAMSGERKSGIAVQRNGSGKPRPSIFGAGQGGGLLAHQAPDMGYGDTGGASRFFLVAPIDDPDAEHTRFLYTSKSSRSERNAGLDGMPERERETQGRDVVREIDRRDGKGRVPVNAQIRPAANHHPTVKPLSLCEWLVTLVTPPGGTILDPFMGSGSIGCAAERLGFNYIGFDLDEEYVAIARRRVAYWAAQGPRQTSPTRSRGTTNPPACDTTDKEQLGLPIDLPCPDQAIA
jgi:site-specific DNA-methyltransferase (adenine-specific)